MRTPSRRRGNGGGWVYHVKNNTVYIPLNTMWIKFRATAGSNNIPDARLTTMSVKVADVEHMDQALQQAHNVLMHTHKGIEDFAFQTQEAWADNISRAIRNARVSGGLIAAIGLLVGGIGIMNIMLASITERIREIGIRKAIGATFTDIFVQILVESVVIAIIGGAAGLMASGPAGETFLASFRRPTTRRSSPLRPCSSPSLSASAWACWPASFPR